MIMIFVAGFISGCTATFLAIYVLSFFDKEQHYDGPKQIEKPRGTFRYGSPVIATAGQYQGMYGKVESVYLTSCFVYFPAQAGASWTMAEVSKSDLRINVPKEEMIEIERQ